MLDEPRAARRETEAAERLDQDVRSGAISIGYQTREDSDLMRLAQANDTAAFDELVSRYRDRVYALAAAAFSDPERIGDVVCEAFLYAYRNIARARTTRPDAWFYISALRAVFVIATPPTCPGSHGA
ncbi:MAG TPA: sigma factor [Candidatus Udaeobacter sp.]|jgi:hypothetical protein|nr:sigma factor [Candidatus Udaeobacter sp.]